MECTVGGFLKERDGIPLLVLGNNYSRIKGYLIRFRPGKEDEAYDRIMLIEPDRVYSWGVIKVSNSDANVLVGRRANRGSFDLEHFDEWDGQTDPFFKEGLEEVEKMLRENISFDGEYRALLRLQMAYTLLWSAIERYAGLKYSLKQEPTQKVLNIAKEKCFADALQRIVQDKDKREVFSTIDPKDKYTLDPSDPEKSLRYYYQVRSNTVHRRGPGVAS
ncbi:MAG: hypothetical protein SWH78_15760 [Thermodesulfobacteriota bacterium]|nr:hypothetical protein [Thermodesulfobacteriota bacterium]